MDGLVEDSQFEAVDERQWVFQVVNCTSLETVSDAFPWAMLTDNFPALKSPGLSGNGIGIYKRSFLESKSVCKIVIASESTETWRSSSNEKRTTLKIHIVHHGGFTTDL